MSDFYTQLKNILSSDSIKVKNIEQYDPKILNEKQHIDVFTSMYEALTIKSKKLKGITHDEIINIMNTMLPMINKWSTIDVLNSMIKNNKNADKQHIYFLETTIYFIDKYPEIIKYQLHYLIKEISNHLHSLKKNVKSLAEVCAEKLLECCGNKDLTPFFPEVIKAIKDMQYSNTAIEKLAGCIFVQNVEYPALCVMLPILRRGLKASVTEVRRKSCVIIDNMAKLIEHPKEIYPLLSELEPMVENAALNISNPEARSVAEKAYKTLLKTKKTDFEYKVFSNDELKNIIKNNIKDNFDHLTKYIESDKIYDLAKVINYMIQCYQFKEDEWASIFKIFLDNNTQELSKITLDSLKNINEVKEEKYIDTEEGADLYMGDFSLAYGSLTLLNNTFLHLKKNRFYGLLGPNNCGKTTLMRAIVREQVDGFPKRDQLKTIFVEHEIKEREVGEDAEGYPIFNTDLRGIDWVVDCCNEVYKMDPKVTREQVEVLMQEIGFGNSEKYPGMERAADAEMGVTTYSGGWKMKMQLCAATLMDADILMLDEPTGHLDVTNIQWLKDFLSDFKNRGGSIICTSHDSAFLNEMCSHIIDFQSRKLVMFREKGGNVLKHFVDKYPEKQGYFELKNDVMKFEFPEPGLLDGKKGNKALLKMNNVTFQYPIRDKPTVFNISLNCSMASRVAVIGPNGAGKSTAIKLLIGELKPTEGVIWKNNSARIAYVAQHAFQHLEKHLNKTPTQYLLWRFSGNMDKESDDFKAAKEEEIIRQKYYLEFLDLEYLVKPAKNPEQLKKAITLKEILNRRDNKKAKTREYEVKWKDKDSITSWVPLIILEKMGCMNDVNRFEEKLAAQQGLMTRALTGKNVEKHLYGFGIEAEQASHTLISSLSGGQKVKVVLAAAMWMCPHLLILDEPTNYLDRDGLGALTKAIEAFKGGVVIISHNREFANAVAQEKWIMEKGRLRKEGESLANMENDKTQESGSLIGEDKIVLDVMGNVIKVDQSKTMNKKGLKKQLKSIQRELKSAKKSRDQDLIDDLNDQIEDLKEKIAKAE